jgi:hypothetical protein
MLAWKQDNNGTTFIAAPVELAHLKPFPHVEATQLGPTGDGRTLFRINITGGLRGI